MVAQVKAKRHLLFEKCKVDQVKAVYGIATPGELDQDVIGVQIAMLKANRYI